VEVLRALMMDDVIIAVLVDSWIAQTLVARMQMLGG
jgi:DNA-binding transcriptional regulator of glucitol operon